MAPQTTQQWTIEGQSGFDSLVFHESVPIPKLGDRDVLVKSIPLIAMGSLLLGIVLIVVSSCCVSQL